MDGGLACESRKNMGIGRDEWACILAEEGNEPALIGELDALGCLGRADAGVVGDLNVGVEMGASAGERVAEEKMEAERAGDAPRALPWREVLMDRESGDGVKCAPWYGEDAVRWVVDEEIGKALAEGRN